MLTHPTHERLITLGLIGMAKAFEEQRRSPDLDALSFEERVGLLVDREAAERTGRSRPASSSPRYARAHAWKTSICARHGIDRAVFANSSAATGSTATRTCSSPGQPGSARAGCLRPRPQSLPRQSFGPVPSRPAPVRGARPCSRRGRYGRLLKTIGRVQLLILDDWSLSVLNPSERRDLLELLDDRHGRASTIVTSQIPVEHWHDISVTPPPATLLDRLVQTLIAFNSPEKACENKTPAIKLLTPPQTPEPITMSVEAAAHDRAK